ncbi:hypothetical protein KIJ96_02805 [Pseudoalteromonas piscicida]|uniref:hypothetical protein n=1 Tax=Pseudoalteromonas TaxID=53246 RepID=UPI0015720EE6|nr:MULTISPECIES: hypothetical protein [Pseudoalteromonas]MCG7552478.1 hypothetical protein [Pseudoalteromonas sp. Of11M-6]UDM62210.1 hypothetical protein KIJ96_02805 [Pseudoalteromonas piscicida]
MLELLQNFESALSSKNIGLAQSIFDKIDALLKALTSEELESCQHQLVDLQSRLIECMQFVNEQKNEAKAEIIGLQGKKSKVDKYSKVKGCMP